MNFFEIVEIALRDTLGPSLAAFRPEMAICATIVALLLARMLAPWWKSGPFWLTVAGALAALGLAAPWQYLSGDAPERLGAIFTGMLVFDTFSVYMRSLLFVFLVFFAVLTRVTGVPDREDLTEFFVLVLGATLGMCLMISANHMLVVFLGIEMASVPSYVLAGMIRHRRQSSEAALKYAVYGAGAAGVMLYGISLLVGVLGSAHLPTMGTQLADMLAGGGFADRTMVLVLGGLMVMIGLAFKLSAVPFHFWLPDVFEGATAEVAALLSIASKAAALALLVRLVIAFGYAPEPTQLAALAAARLYMAMLIGTLAAVTCTFGNLAAYGQTNMKRLLGYSTIAHAGYMMMPVAALAMLMGGEPAAARAAVSAVALYAAIYLFMNLGAFAVVALVRNATGSEEIDAYRGLVYRSTGAAVCFSIILFSLVGLPPLAGFVAKFVAFASVYDAGLLALLAVGLANTFLSLFYYLRVVKMMLGEAEDAPNLIPMASSAGLYCLIVTAPLVVWGIWWDGIYAWAKAASALLF